jgi:hypothetical protein
MHVIFFLLTFFISGSVFCQECKLNKTTDPYTREIKLSTGFIQLDGGSLTIDADNKEVDFLFSIEGTDRCFDNNSTAYIFFENSKSKGSARNGGSMNCEGLFHFIFRNSTSTTALLQRMMTQRITHIVFTGNNKKESTVTLGPLEQDAIKAFANCLVNEAKTLLK